MIPIYICLMVISHLTIPNVHLCCLKLKHSKTNQERKGIKIIIGKTGDDLCPISTMLSFLKFRGSHPVPLFCWKSGTPLSKSRFVDSVISSDLLADSFVEHSFHIGAATTAASAGICDSSIQSLGRWKSIMLISTVYQN